MKQKVMIVDDDMILCEIGKEMFEILDIEAFTAQTLKEAVDTFTANQAEIGLVVFDLNLDENTGDEVFQALIQINPDFHGVIASGAYIDENDKKFAGFKEFIMKPYNLNTLKDLAAKYLP
jgi:DNA-binding NtrC family response regulator